MNYLTGKLSKKYGVVTHINPTRKISSLEYADDIILFDSSMDKAYYHLKELENEAKKIGLEINLSKTKFIANSRAKKQNNKLDKIISQVDEFKYLGANIASSESEIANRIIQARIPGGASAPPLQ
jgi:hypothetical protein